MPETLAATSPIPSVPFIPPGGEQAARVTIGPGPDLQLASMQFSPASHAAVQTALMKAYGVEAPVTPHARDGHDAVRFIWAGLDQWLVCAPQGQADLLDGLRRVTQPHAAITAQGDGRSVIRVRGRDSRAILSKLVPIDLHPRAFAPDSTALTLAGHIPVQILQHDMTPTYDLFVFRSLAHSLYHDLCHAARGGVPVSEVCP
ncbi:sarcosine oxidase subunit gamma family protein [Komagataeibacter oboediens]|uniref:sarcosine oxidase subunit gamma n=1 Tax=Komagataeibacter oboediens TaxID=65958 RepID=UPI0023DA7CA9|nr:sarcosine oxidase subunit gamma family protein [Komagataeibacter oboediens]WEQ51083.1 sarcosine oxidase subunit gamma family protein [Komagataeibacter oboediens]